MDEKDAAQKLEEAWLHQLSLLPALDDVPPEIWMRYALMGFALHHFGYAFDERTKRGMKKQLKGWRAQYETLPEWWYEPIELPF
jgi:hypothetical protein